MNMENKELDIIIFGATGFTGRYVAKEMVKYGHKYLWGVAGRNKQKLQEILKDISSKTGQDVTGVPVIIADCGNVDSINEMAKKSKIIINCCGPFQLYGEVVIQACIKNNCHYLDVTGEAEFMDTMKLKYADDATEEGVYVVSACGFDCIPVDMGVQYLKKHFDGILNSVEVYIGCTFTDSMQGPAGNYGTWHSAICELSRLAQRLELEKKLFPKGAIPDLKPRLKLRSAVHRSPLVENKYCIPYLGADPVVVKRSQLEFYMSQDERPAQCQVYFVCNTFLALLSLLFAGMMVLLFSRFEFGRKLLLNYPEFFSFGYFSHKEPSLDVVDKTTGTFVFHGEGWSKESVEGIEDKVTVSLPTNKTKNMKMSITSGYEFTSKGIIFCALAILEEKEKLPSEGGIYTTAVAFGDTKVFEKLIETGTSVEFSE